MHKIGQKIVSCLLITAMTGSLAACGGKTAKSSGELTISVYQSDEWLEVAVEKFEELHPDVKISVHSFYSEENPDMYSSGGEGDMGVRPTGQTREDYIARLNTQIMSGEAEDLIVTSLGIPVEKYIQMGVFEDLSPYLEKSEEINEENYYMNIFEACRAKDGGLYQFPLSAMAVPLMVFDTELMEDTGVKLPEGTNRVTWREGLDMAKEMYDTTTLPGTYMPDANAVVGNLFSKAAMDAIDYKEGKVEFNRERMLDLLKVYVELADYKTDTQQSSEDVNHVPFRIAYRPDVEWALDIVAYGMPVEACQWEYDDGKVYLCPYYALDFGINSASPNKDTAWEFLKFLVSDEIQTLPSLPWAGVNRKGLQARVKGALGTNEETEYTEEQKQAVFELVEKWVMEIDAYRQEDTDLITLTEGVLAQFKDGNLSAYETLDDLENKLTQFMSENSVGKETVSGEQTAESAVVTEDFSMPEKKINPTRFSDLPLAAEEAGFAFYALEEFSNGYKFSKFSVSEQKLKLRYLHANGVWSVDVLAYPLEEEPEHSVLYEWTKEIEGVQVSLDTYILRMVPSDYELTEEDWELVDSGKYNFSCDGVSEGDSFHYTLYFIRDGVYYEFSGAIEQEGFTTLTLEEFEEMVAEFLQNAKLQGEI